MKHFANSIDCDTRFSWAKSTPTLLKFTIVLYAVCVCVCTVYHVHLPISFVCNAFRFGHIAKLLVVWKLALSDHSSRRNLVTVINLVSCRANKRWHSVLACRFARRKEEKESHTPKLLWLSLAGGWYKQTLSEALLLKYWHCEHSGDGIYTELSSKT